MGDKLMTQTAIREALSHYSLSDLMSKQVLTVYEGWSVKRLAGFFVKHGISGAPVIASDDELVGVVTQSDVVRFESRTPTEDELKKLVHFYCGPFGGELSEEDIRHMQERANENCTVNSIMTPQVLSVEVDSGVSHVCKTIVDHEIHRLFITSGGKLIGVLTARDVLRKLLEE